MRLQRILASGTVLIALSSAHGIGAASGSISHRSGASLTQRAGDLRYKAPKEWVIEHPTSTMRLAQYKLPRVAGDSEDASLVLYYFGSDQGGSVQDNIDRWVGQIEQPDGTSSSDRTKTDKLTVNGLRATLIDVAGTYTAETSPGSGLRHNKPSYRLLAAIVETPKGNYFAKLVGPEKTVNRWNQAFIEYVKSFEFKAPEKGMNAL